MTRETTAAEKYLAFSLAAIRNSLMTVKEIHFVKNWRLGAVLLDMDGTLLDTERMYLDSLIYSLEAFGYPDGIALGHAMIGIPGPECDKMLQNRFGSDFPFTAFNAAFNARCDDILREGLPLKSGAIELLDALRDAACLMAIVTSSSRRTAERYLTLGGIRSRFETVVTRDDVANGKPSPDLYLFAADSLGVPPQACVAIEDSNPGIVAAHSAGAIPILVPDIVQPTGETRTKCHAVLNDLHEALVMLRERFGLTHPPAGNLAPSE